MLHHNDNIVKSVQLLVDDQNPYSADLVLNMINDGIKLVYDGVSQRLKYIEITLSKVKLRYQ